MNISPHIIALITTFWYNLISVLTSRNVALFQRLEKYRKTQMMNILRFLQNTTPVQQLLNVGPILRMNSQCIWMKPRSSHWWEHIVLETFDNSDWLENFRMKKDTFIWLCDQLRHKLTPSEKHVRSREPLSVEKQVAITLYFLASCAEYRIIGNSFGVHKSTVWKCVHRVVSAINSELMESCLNFPNSEESEEIAFHFEKKTHIPQLIGAIDGTHIPVLPPSDGYRDFINRKGWPSIVLQAVVDHSYRFRNINCKSPGSTHDAAVFRESKLFQEYNTFISKKTKPVDGMNIPFMLMGDPAYPLLPWLIKGYTKSGRLSPEEESFNVHLNCGRVAVEIAFGRLKARWRCLLKRLDVHFTFVPHLVAACCILHNIVESRKERFLKQWEQSVQEAELLFPTPEASISRERDNYAATAIREKLKNYLKSNFPLRRTIYQ